MRALSDEPVAAWRRAPTPWRLAYAVGAVLILVGVAHGLVWLAVGGPWDGPVSFRKPYTFGVSFGLTTITLAWFADRALALWTARLQRVLRRRVRLVAAAAIACAALVLAGTMQWLDGRAATQVRALDGALGLVAVATLAVVALLAARPPRVGAATVAG